MNTLESIIIIPLLIIIILFTFSLFSFASQIGLDEMNYSRNFFLAALEHASINDESVDPSIQIVNKELLFTKTSTFLNHSTIVNQFVLPNRAKEFQNSGSWQIIRYSRTFLALASENSSIFMREDNDE